METREGNYGGFVTTTEIPVWYKFTPTEEQLVTFHLAGRILNQSLPPNNVKEIELYEYTPDQLEEHYGPRRENEMYFFTKRRPKTPTAIRPNRIVRDAGVWKAGKKTDIKDSKNGEIIGCKMLLNFRDKTNTLTKWAMYEYVTASGAKEMKELALCKVYKKRNYASHRRRRVKTREDQSTANQQFWTSYGFQNEPEMHHHYMEHAFYRLNGVVLHNHDVQPQASDDRLQEPVDPQIEAGLNHQNLQEAFSNVERYTWNDLYEIAVIDFKAGKPYVSDNQADAIVLQYQDVKPHQPIYDRFVDVGLHDQSVAPQSPTCQAYDVGFHNQHVPMIVTVESKVVAANYDRIPTRADDLQYQNLDVQVPTNQYNSEDHDCQLAQYMELDRCPSPLPNWL